MREVLTKKPEYSGKYVIQWGKYLYRGLNRGPRVEEYGENQIFKLFTATFGINDCMVYDSMQDTKEDIEKIKEKFREFEEALFLEDWNNYKQDLLGYEENVSLEEELAYRDQRKEILEREYNEKCSELKVVNYDDFFIKIWYFQNRLEFLEGIKEIDIFKEDVDSFGSRANNIIFFSKQDAIRNLIDFFNNECASIKKRITLEPCLLETLKHERQVFQQQIQELQAKSIVINSAIHDMERLDCLEKKRLEILPNSIDFLFGSNKQIS